MERIISNDDTNKIDSKNMDNYIKNLHDSKKLLLVLDIDHTLVHATNDKRAKIVFNNDILKKDVHTIQFIDPSFTKKIKYTVTNYIYPTYILTKKYEFVI